MSAEVNIVMRSSGEKRRGLGIWSVPKTSKKWALCQTPKMGNKDVGGRIKGGGGRRRERERLFSWLNHVRLQVAVPIFMWAFSRNSHLQHFITHKPAASWHQTDWLPDTKPWKSWTAIKSLQHQGLTKEEKSYLEKEAAGLRICKQKVSSLDLAMEAWCESGALWGLFLVSFPWHSVGVFLSSSSWPNKLPVSFTPGKMCILRAKSESVIPFLGPVASS